MRISVVIPTHNRASLLRRTLESLARARLPANTEIEVVVVDNASTDDTRTAVQSTAVGFPYPLRCVYEAHPGRSWALNAGIDNCQGDIVAMIDDDEECDEHWFEVIVDAFADPALGFLTGPYRPRWGASPPSWLPMRPSAVIGWVDGGDKIKTFGVDYNGVLMGGNAAVRRELLLATGGYATHLGRTPGKRLMSAEDYNMQLRLEKLGARGLYRPDLVIYHYVPPERMTFGYHIRWHLWNGVSMGIHDREFPQAVTYLLGIPRYVLGDLVRSIVRMAGRWMRLRSTAPPGESLATLLKIVSAAGFVRGKHWPPKS
jgi:glycosyltransferase involved in cell wall biosynthesis